VAVSDANQVDHFQGGAMVMQDDGMEGVHGCRHVGNVAIDHFQGGRMLMESGDEAWDRAGKKAIEARNTVDHFEGNMGVSASGSENLNKGLSHTGASLAEVDHFAGGTITMGEDAGDGFGGTLDGAARGHVAGHDNATLDHFTGMSMNESAGNLELMSIGGVGIQLLNHEAAMQLNSAGKSADHFQGGTMGMAYGGEDLVDKEGNHISSVAHGTGEKSLSWDHFQGGGMGLGQYGSTELISVGGTELHGLKHSGDHHKSEDHFGIGGFDLDESADSGILSVGGAIINHKHHDDTANTTQDHFANGGMSMGGSGKDGSEGAVMLSADGSVLKGVAHQSAHGAAEHSFDHFSGGGMGLAANAGDIALMGAAGGLSKGVGHVKGHQMSEEHFNSGMVLEGEGEVTDAFGHKLTHSHHVKGHGKDEDHFGSGGAFVPETGHGHGLSRADRRNLNKNKHFKSFYT